LPSPQNDLGPFVAKQVQTEDAVRAGLAIAFSLAFIIALGCYLYFYLTIPDAQLSRVKDAFGVVLPAVTGVLGTTLGFYFGKKS
jgi:hypothetical protein